MKALLTRYSISVLTSLAAAMILAAWPTAPVQAAPKEKPVPISHTERQARPIQLGTSGGSVVDTANGYCCSGTLGALVQDVEGNQYILSNTHVFAGDSVPGGNGVSAAVGDSINQPGFVDVGCQVISTDFVATLADWVELLPGSTSTVDAAIAQVMPGMVDPAGSILEIGTISSDPATAVVGQLVKKSGRTSGLTRGKVAGLNATVTVQYEDECGGNPYTVTFTNQILATPGKFLKAGDSGSLMVEDVSVNPRPVGLLFAGSNRIAIANPIQEVLTNLAVTMVGVPSAVAPASDSLVAAVEEVSKIKERNAASLAKVPKALGHAVGLTNGKPVILLLVEETSAATEASAPKKLDGVAVEVWEVGPIKAY